MIGPYEALRPASRVKEVHHDEPTAVTVTGRQIELMHKRGIWIRPDRI